jgi:cytochrome c peroxidase
MEYRTIRSFAHRRLTTAVAILLLAGAGSVYAQPGSDPTITADDTGMLQTTTPTNTIDRNNAFFKSFGPNGRTCESCHQQAQGWSMTPEELTKRFNKTKGTDPVFALVDGANSPTADVSTVAARRLAYSMMLNRGTVRVGLPIPANAEFRLSQVQDPYGHASASDLSLFRRPLPSTNLIWDTAMMWDGRETVTKFLAPMDAGVDRQDINLSLASQARDAILGHEQAATAPDDATILSIVDFESHLFTAQLVDQDAGKLNHADGMGGANILAQQSFWVGINDTLGNDPTGEPFNEASMRLFDEWNDADVQQSSDAKDKARASIARGEKLFNSLPINISGVAGLNDVTGLTVIRGTCTTCHNSPNIGNHSVALPVNIGIADASRRTPDMPLYTLTNLVTGQNVQTTDPGLALITGKWADIGKFKGPILRGVAARAPYFHNGMAATLDDAVEFYRTRFNIAMNAKQKKDLVAFLSAL